MTWSDLFKAPSSQEEFTADQIADIRLRLGLTDHDAALSLGDMAQAMLTRIERLDDQVSHPPHATLIAEILQSLTYLHETLRSVEARVGLMQRRQSEDTTGLPAANDKEP